MSCDKEDITPGSISLGTINAGGNMIKSSNLDVKEEINPGLITVLIDINIFLYSFVIFCKQYLFGICRFLLRINNDQIAFHHRYT